GCRVVLDFRSVLRQIDAVMALRVQHERQALSFLPSQREYAALWGLDATAVGQMKPGALVLHPGPVNRGVELSGEVLDGPRSVVLEQVSNGLAVRMAILERAA
ncbi:MAG TPA: aspartate carbamoyltransferase, partial [Myxococcales bacterium]